MANRRIFAAFHSKLTSLVGQDVLAQRVPNVVLQPPNHPTPTELHRDAPANSPYEIVVWLPLVDCHHSKSMYILNRESTRAALELYRLNPNDAEAFEGLLDARAELVDVPYGSALLFWSALFHGSQINTESETRVSLNTRYKHLFAPLGMKIHSGTSRFFRRLNLRGSVWHFNAVRTCEEVSTRLTRVREQGESGARGTTCTNIR
jgi:sporadic carbohydrate cluster 2OG-Fe(II) oxygenase